MEVAEPAKPTPQFYAARLRRLDRTLPGATTADHRTAPSSIPASGVQFLMPDAEASISEEPGARKRHAGICAGAVRAPGRPTAMPDTPHPEGSSIREGVNWAGAGTAQDSWLQVLLLQPGGSRTTSHPHSTCWPLCEILARSRRLGIEPGVS